MRPTFKCAERDYGVSIASRRAIGEDKRYWRVNQFLAPFWTLVPPQSKFPELSGHAWVPMDDEHTLCLMFSYTPVQPLYPRTRELLAEGTAAARQAMPAGIAMRQSRPQRPMPTSGPNTRLRMAMASITKASRRASGQRGQMTRRPSWSAPSP